MEGELTEAEFRAFSLRLSEFARGLTPNEDRFLTVILARACARPDPSLEASPSLEGAVCTDLVYSIWQSMRFPYGPSTVNPLPVAFTGEKS